MGTKHSGPGVAGFAALLVLLPLAAAPTQPAAGPVISTAVLNYTVPAVQLVRDDNKVVSLPEEMNDGRPVVLNFIFTSCSSICPLMSQVLAQFQQRLGAESRNVHLMSISVDPEQDTPAQLREYAHKFHAGPSWQHYTGTVEASLAAQRAFNVWRGDKMGHTSVTFMRITPDKPWLRIDGFVTPEELLERYRQLRSAIG
jgi:protein SCO1/2